MEAKRPGSWSLVISTMVAVYLGTKYIASKVPYLFTPMVIFCKFLVERYAEEIERFIKWTRSLWPFGEGGKKSSCV